MAKRSGKGSEGSSRPTRVQEAMREELARLLSDGTVKDPRLEKAMLTVTEVRVTADLEHAKVFVSGYGDSDGIRDAFRGLKSAASLLRREVTRRLQLRFAPELHFEFDESIQQGARIETLLKEIAADRDNSGSGSNSGSSE